MTEWTAPAWCVDVTCAPGLGRGLRSAGSRPAAASLKWDLEHLLPGVPADPSETAEPQPIGRFKEITGSGVSMPRALMRRSPEMHLLEVSLEQRVSPSTRMHRHV